MVSSDSFFPDLQPVLNNHSLNVCSPLNAFAQNLTPRVVVFWGEILGRLFG